MSGWNLVHWEGPIWIIFKKSLSVETMAYADIKAGRVKWFASSLYGGQPQVMGNLDVDVSRYWHAIKGMKPIPFEWGRYPFFGIMRAIAKFYTTSDKAEIIPFADGRPAINMRDGEGSLEWSILLNGDGHYVTHYGDADDILHSWLIQGALRS